MCQDGYCRGSSASSQGTCTGFMTANQLCDVNDTDPCGVAAVCASGSCKPLRGLGEPCSFMGANECKRTLICNSRDGGPLSCVPESRPGDPCGQFYFCAVGYCGFDGGLCSEWKPLGAGCASGYECASGGCYDGGCVQCFPPKP
jgi:hypothetical protein